MQMVPKRCNWLLFHMQIALINVYRVWLSFIWRKYIFDPWMSEGDTIYVTMLLNVVSNVNIVIECSFRATVAHFRLNENKFPLN